MPTWRGNVQFVNQAGRALVGLTQSRDTQGEQIAEFIHEASRELFVAEILPVVMAAGHWSGELQFRDFLTDAAVPVLCECFRIDDAAGKPINIATVSRDIVERKRNEPMLARHNRMLQTIASLNDVMLGDLSERQLMTRICQTLVQDNRFRLAWIGRLEPDGVHLRVTAGAGLGQERLGRADIRCDQSPQGSGPTGEAIRLERTVIDDDTATNERPTPWRDLALSQAFSSSAATPLRLHGQVVGAVSLYSDEADAFGPDEVVLLEKLAADLGSVMQRRAAEAALRDSEERYRQISSVTTDVLYSCVRDDRSPFQIVWANGSVERIFGCTVQQLLERRCWRCLVHPDDLAIFDAKITALTAGQSSGCELRIIRSDGSVRFLQTYTKVVEAQPNTHLNRLYGACQDITERKTAESALAESERRYRALFDASGDCILVLRGDQIADCNSVATSILAPTRGKIIGQSIIRFSPESQPDGRLSAAKASEIIDAALRGEARIFEWRLPASTVLRSKPR